MKHMILLTLCLLCMCMPAAGSMAEPAQNLPATIDGGDADRVHLRAKPSIQSESLGLYYTGTALSCESDPTQEWTKVVIGAQEGYVKSEYLRWGDDSKNVQSQQPQGTIKANGWVNMRSAPSKEAQIKTKLYEGDAVSILGETDSLWYLVATPQAIGYVWSNHIQLQNHSLRYNPLGSTDELSFEFGQLAFHYGDSFSAIMKKANDAGYVFECLGPHKIYHYDIYDEENFIQRDIGMGFDDDLRIDYVSLNGGGTINQTIEYPITFGDLCNKLGSSVTPQVFVTSGKVFTVCYLWIYDQYSVQAMAWPLSIKDLDNLEIDSIDIYSNKREPVQIIP